MGITDSKTISLHIDNEFKSIRKYHDNFYGQITLVQQQSSGKLFALIQKIIISVDKSFSEFLVIRKQFNPYLVKLHSYYHCNVDYCSGLEKYFFLLEYSQHTLYQEMAIRQQFNQKFTSEDLFNVFNCILQMISYLKDKNNMFKSFISNHFILYNSPQEMKTLENLLKVESQSFQFDFHVIKNDQGSKHLYLAPQAYTLLCNKERFEAKHISLTQKAIIFMLGMNFIECALLADISGVYNSYKKQINFVKLSKVLQQIEILYGEEIYQMISSMVSENLEQRPTLQELKDFIKINMKRRKIVIPKQAKIEHMKIKQLKV